MSNATERFIIIQSYYCIELWGVVGDAGQSRQRWGGWGLRGKGRRRDRGRNLWVRGIQVGGRHRAWLQKAQLAARPSSTGRNVLRAIQTTLTFEKIQGHGQHCDSQFLQMLWLKREQGFAYKRKTPDAACALDSKLPFPEEKWSRKELLGEGQTLTYSWGKKMATQ